MMMTGKIRADKGNPGVMDGTILPAIQGIMDQLKPEAAYFFPKDGQRAFLFVFDIASEPDMIPAVEPLWLGLEADIELTPVMNFQDLQAGLQKLPRH